MASTTSTFRARLNKALYPLIDHVIFRRVNRAYAALADKHDWPYFPFRPKATGFLFIQPSVESFEYPRANTAPQVHFVGPLMPQLAADSPRPTWWVDLEEARRSGRPIVLLTQGTIATDSTELIEPTLEAMKFEDVFVVAAGADPATLSDIPANARVERFVPFGPLMPLVDAYVTNGGYGGVTIALGQRGTGGQRRYHRGQGRSGWAGGVDRSWNQPEDQSAHGRAAADGDLLDPSRPVISAAGRRDTAGLRRP
jgi:UDP:flavonoid glycosyltransferase YjiC (YdhE family)